MKNLIATFTALVLTLSIAASAAFAQKPTPGPIVFQQATPAQVQAISAARNAGKTRPLSEPQRKACLTALQKQYPNSLNCITTIGGIYQETELTRRGRFYCHSYVWVYVCGIMLVYDMGLEEGTCDDFGDDDDGPLT